MNSSTVIKKTLPLIIILLIIIGVAVTCTVLSKEKDNPVIGNPDGVYLTAKEGEFTYKLTNSRLYDELKENVGISSLVTMINKDLLKDTKKGGISYWDKVTQEAIDDEVEKATFPDGKDELTAEEITEAEEKFLDTMFSSYGLVSMTEIENHYRLILAKKLYAADKLEEEIATKNAEAKKDSEKYFTQSDYTSYYTSNYKSEYWAMIVPFSTEAQAKNALAQLGITIKTSTANTSDDFTRWVKTVGEEEVALTTSEVVAAMVSMYNTTRAFQTENYPINRLVLTEGKQYTINEEGLYQFNTTVSEEDETLNALHYTYDEIYAYQSSVQNYLKNTMVSYTTSSEVTYTQKWFTPTPQSYSSGSIYCFIMKLAEVAAPEQSTVNEEIYKKLVEKTLTDTFVETKMAELRQEKGLVIYDTFLEKQYVSSAKTYKVTHETTKKASENLVASIEGHEYTTDQLFDAMDKIYGISLAITLINEERFLVNTNYNKYFDTTSTANKEKDKWLDQEKYQELTTEVSNEKLNFSAGAYESYGYGPSTMKWEEFLQSIYGVSNEQELRMYFLKSDIISDFKKSLGDLSEVDETSPLWQFYLEKMELIKEKIFTTTGVHLLISAYEDPMGAVSASSNMLDPKDWSEYQVTCAKELTDQVKAYIASSEGTIKEKLEAVVAAFKASPRFIANLEQTVAAQPVVEGVSYVFEGIEVAKFKSAGLTVKYEDLGEITNGEMVEEFEAAVKSIWLANPESDSMVIYNDYIQTKFGFHVYANLTTKPLATWEDAEGNTQILPSLEIIKKYIEDAADEDLTEEMKKAIETYYSPIFKELSTDGYYAAIKQYQAINGMDITFSKTNYTRESFLRAIDMTIKKYEDENLTYIK